MISALLLMTAGNIDLTCRAYTLSDVTLMFEVTPDTGQFIMRSAKPGAAPVAGSSGTAEINPDNFVLVTDAEKTVTRYEISRVTGDLNISGRIKTSSAWVQVGRGRCSKSLGNLF